MYLLMSYFPWSSLEVQVKHFKPRGVPTNELDSCGFMLVYPNYEEELATAKGDKSKLLKMEVQIKERKTDDLD